MKPDFKIVMFILSLGPLKEEQTVLDCILGLPRKCVRGFVKRTGLFIWWTGVWTNEGEELCN